MKPVHPFTPDEAIPREGYVQVEQARVYYRDTGKGLPIIAIHGGPDFDHNYLLPDLDRLSSSFRVIYYDQRGRGNSAGGVQPDDVTIQSEMADLERLEHHLQLGSVALLGHSWGGVLAMEYAIRYPHRVSHLILMNTGPASHKDYLLFREELARKRAAGEVETLRALSSGARYRAGDLDIDAEYHRVHFRAAVRRSDDLRRLMHQLRLGITSEGIVKARAIEDRLYAETWWSAGYDLLPALRRLDIPTLLLCGDHDFIPAEIAAHIAEAISGARLAMLRECGHFTYLECPEQVREELIAFLGPQAMSTGTASSTV